MNAKKILACFAGAALLALIAHSGEKAPTVSAKASEEVIDAQALALAQVEREGLAAIKTMEARGWRAVSVDVEKRSMGWRFVKDSAAIHIRTKDGIVYDANAEFYPGD